MTYTIYRDGKAITLTDQECAEIFRTQQREYWLQDLEDTLDTYAMEFEEQAVGLADWLKEHLEDARDTYERRLENGWGWEDAARDALYELARDYEGVEA